MVSSLARLVRLPNLVIVGLTQFLLGHILYGHVVNRILSGFDFGLLVGVTMLIAAGGYVINDIFDRELDAINKPEKVVVGRFLSEKIAYTFYWTLVTLGFALAVYLSIVIGDYRQLLIYPFAVWMLWAYAKFFKKHFVTGNVVVAAYCAFVPGILIYAERAAFVDLWNIDAKSARFVGVVFVVYALMAFLTTVWREVIKDMEDVKGDQAHGSRSIPAKHGLLLARKIASTFGAIILLLILYYIILLIPTGQWSDIIYLMLPFLTALVAFVIPFKSLLVRSLHLASQLIKVLMALGVGYLFFLL